MRWSSGFRALVFISGFFVASTVLAQTQADEIGQLPTTLSTEQLQSLTQVSPAVVPRPRNRGHRGGCQYQPHR